MPLRPLSDLQLTATVYGQPPSGNHQYEGYGSSRRKKSSVEDYQNRVISVIRRTIDHWPLEGDIRVTYSFRLGRRMDCSNVIKVVEDAIAEALCPGIDPPRCCRKFDERFLPTVSDRVFGVPDPSVSFVVEPERA